MASGTFYSEAENRYLIENHGKLTAAMMAADLGRPIEGIFKRISILKKQGAIHGRGLPDQVNYKKYRIKAHQEKQRLDAADTGLIRFEHQAILDEVRAYLAMLVTTYRMTYRQSVLLMLRLQNHLETRGSAKLAKTPVMGIIEILQQH
jgi:hypothetical protein